MDNDDLIKRHKTSLRGIFNGYTCKKFVRSRYFWFSIGLALLLTVPYIVWGKGQSVETMPEKIGSLANIVLSAFPSLLGFSLAGYALIIGTINIGVMRMMSKPQEAMSDMSYFQFVSSVFALSVLVQCITLSLAFVVKVVLEQKWEMVVDISSGWVNYPAYVFLMLLVIESLALLANTVINIFTYGQTVHFCLRQEEEMPTEDSSIWVELKDCIYSVVRKLLNKHE